MKSAATEAVLGSGARTQTKDNSNQQYSVGSERSQPFLNAAVRLAQAGLAVFPLTPGAKVPLPGSHGYRDAACDPAIAGARWQQYPNANIAIATGPVSGLWVLDIDQGGDKSLVVLEALYDRLPKTVEASTPRGGRHLYFQWIDGIGNSAGRIGPGLDVRGKGGYVVAPPSVLANPAHTARSLPGSVNRLTTCPECSAIRVAGQACVACGWKPERHGEHVDVADGQLGQVDRTRRVQENIDTPEERTRWHAELSAIGSSRGYKPGWTAHKFRERFGTWPQSQYTAPKDPSQEVLSWVRSRNIAYAKARAKVGAA